MSLTDSRHRFRGRPNLDLLNLEQEIQAYDDNLSIAPKPLANSHLVSSFLRLGNVLAEIALNNKNSPEPAEPRNNAIRSKNRDSEDNRYGEKSN